MTPSIVDDDAHLFNTPVNLLQFLIPAFLLKLLAELVKFLAKLRYYLIPDVFLNIFLCLVEFFGELLNRFFSCFTSSLSGTFCISSLNFCNCPKDHQVYLPAPYPSSGKWHSTILSAFPVLPADRIRCRWRFV